MAASDVLQFNCSIENEVAQNATKDFAGMLGKAFEQYKKLWNEYLMLRKYCEDVDVKIPFRVLESESCRNINVLSKISAHCTEPCNEQPSQESGNTKMSTSACESASYLCSSDVTSDFDDTIFSDNKSSQTQMKGDELLKSPVLIKRRKSRKTSVTPNNVILDDSEENNEYIPIKENISISESNSQQNIMETPIESKRNECSFVENNDQIECTPISKVPKKLGVSKLYNVDTTLFQSGKKLRQSKLVFLPSEQSVDNTAYKMRKVNPLKPHMSPTPKTNITENSKARIKSIDEEIIENSPNKRTISNLKVKGLKLKKKSPIKSLREGSTFGKVVESKNSDAKLAKISQQSVSQYLPHIQKDEPYSIKKSKTVGSSCSVGNNCDNLSSTFSTVVDAEDLCFDDTDFDIDLSTPVKETKKVEVTEDDHQAQKRKFSKSTSQTLDCDSSAYNDETYCVLGEKLKENSAYDTGELKQEVCENSMLSPSPPVKKSLMSSFDKPPEKKDVFVCKPSKSKSERAKMSGVSCWECKQYYANLGLSENEIKTRQNQCSRHRTKYNERQNTPEGFWHPLFPDTFSSTFHDE